MDIFLESRIWPDSFDFFKWQINNTPENEINIFIASIGGSVDAGFAIANYIEAVNSKGAKRINTHILSNADSIATVIFLAPPKEQRTIVESSTMFIHDPRFIDLMELTSETADKMAEALRIQENRIADYYVKKIDGLTKDEAVKLMKGETTLTAADMLKYNIVSEIKAAFNIAAFKSNINQNQINMSLFSKKGTLAVVALVQGTVTIQAAHRGAFAENTELEQIGEGEAINGEFVIDGKNVTIENNVVKTIKAIETAAAEGDESTDVSEQIALAMAPVMDLVEKMQSQIEALAGQKSTHKPSKVNVDNSNADGLDAQAVAKKASKERQKQNYQPDLTRLKVVNLISKFLNYVLNAWKF